MLDVADIPAASAEPDGKAETETLDAEELMATGEIAWPCSVRQRPAKRNGRGSGHRRRK